MFSEIIIACTLIVNAGAVLNFKLKRRREQESFIETSQEPSLGDKIRDFLEALRYFRAFIGIWNIFVIFLMLVFFGS